MLTHGNLASNVEASCAVVTSRAQNWALDSAAVAHLRAHAGISRTTTPAACIAYAESHLRLLRTFRSEAGSLGGGPSHLREVLFTDHGRHLADAREKAEDRPLGLNVAEDGVSYRVEQTAHAPLLAIKSFIAEKSSTRNHRTGWAEESASCVGWRSFVAATRGVLHRIGIEVLEGYGLTETSPVISVNTFEARRLKTVGKILPESR